jgi:Bacterial-like globin
MRKQALMVLAVMGCGGGTMTPDAGSTLYDKYGAAGFTAVNNSIITKAAAAPTSSVGTSFSTLTPAKVDALKANLGAFLIQAYGGPKNYTGRTMLAAHTGLQITEAQYDYFISEVVVKALSENGVSSDDITNGFAPPVTEKKAGSIKCDTVQSGTKPTGCP